MKGKCALKPCVRTKDGKVVESRLFNSLFSILKNRPEAWKHYNIATNPDFISTLQHAELDENGELTFESYVNAVQLDVADKISTELEKKLGERTNLSFNDASQKINSFNRNNTEHHSYMATMEKQKNGSYNVKIVKKTSQAENALANTIKNQSIQNKLIYHLNKAGVSVKFLQQGRSRYSTENAKQTFENLWELIDWVEKNGEKELSEEAGHFIIGATKGTPLNDRFLALVDKLNKEDAIPLEREELANKNLGEDEVSELAGMLVAKSLNNQMQGPLVNLAYRISMLLKKALLQIDKNQLRNDVREAELKAYDLAKSFLNDNIQGSVTNALKYKETLFSNFQTNFKNIHTSIQNTLSSLYSNMKNIESFVADDLAKLFERLNPYDSSSTGVFAASSIAAVVNELSQSLPNIIEALRKDVPLEGKNIKRAEFALAFIKNADKLAQLEKLEDALNAILDVLIKITNTAQLEEAVMPIVLSGENEGIQYGVSLHYSDRLADLIQLRNELSAYLRNAREVVVYNHLSSLFSEEFVDTAIGVMWKGTDPSLKTINVSSIMAGSEDINAIEFRFGTLANSKDIMAQLYDKALKQANYRAHKQSEKDYAEIMYLAKQAKDAGITDFSIFYEKDEKGKFTHSLITDISIAEKYGIIQSYYVKWALFEKDLEEQMNLWDAEFRETDEGKQLFDAGNLNIYKIKFNNWVSERKQQWLHENGVYDHSKQCWGPNPHIDRYKLNVSFTDAQIHWYNQYRKLLDNLNDRIPNRMPVHRAPQFKASFINRLTNYWKQSNIFLKPFAPFVSIWQGISYAFSTENDPEAYGSMTDYIQSIKTNYNTLVSKETALRRLPYFGIRKMKNPNMMSTDLISNIIAYSAMVNKNVANKEIVSLLEIGMAYREKNNYFAYDDLGNIINKDNGAHAKPLRATAQLRNYIDKHVYGIGMPKVKILTIFLNSVARIMNTVTSFIWLGGNWKGGAVNAAIGLTEIFKEVSAHSDIETRYLWKAMGAFVAGMTGSVADFLTQEDQHKISLFAQKFRILGENEYKYTERDSKTGRILSALTNAAIMGPYSAGEYMMQILPFMALAMQEQVITEEGETISLWDALTVAPHKKVKYVNDNYILLDPKEINTKVNRLDYTGNTFATIEDRNTYIAIQKDLEKIANKGALAENDLSTLTLDFLKSKGVNVKDVTKSEYITIDTVRKLLTKESKTLLYENTKQQDFEDRARVLTNNMHGVYNGLDKPTASRTLLGSAMLTLRGYLLGIIERRFGSNKYSVALGRRTEGSTVSMLKAAIQIFEADYEHKIKKDGTIKPVKISKSKVFKWKTWADVMYFSTIGLFYRQGRDKRLKQRGFEKYQLDNIQRFNSDLLALLCFILSRHIIKWIDDDEENEALGFLYYLNTRLMFDQGVFLNPKMGYNEAHSITESILPGVAAITTIADILVYSYGALRYQDYYNSEGKKSEEHKKYYEPHSPNERGVPKVLKKIQKITPWWKSVNNVNGYEAAERYMDIMNKQK